MPSRSAQRTLGFDSDTGDESTPKQPPAASDEAPSPVPSRSAPPAGPLQPGDLEGQTVWVVDSHSLIFQVFHVIAEMTSPAGQPTNAVYGFTRDMLFLLETKQPDYLFCAFDLSGPTFRHQLYDQYKIDREEMPEALRPQIPLVKQVLAGFHIPVLEYEAFEADDILATVAPQVEAAGGECVLVTGDKDCRQLITDRVRVYNIRKDAMFGADELMDDWGIRPDQVVDFQSLVGDKVDNVPGVPLIGPKIAGGLLNDFETLEGVFNNLDKVSGKKRKENLENGKEQALLSRQLVRLADDVPLTIDWSAGHVGGFDREALLETFHELGFRSFGERVEALEGVDAPKQWEADYRVVDTPVGLAELINQLSRQSRIAVDTETTHTNPRFAEIVGYSFSWQSGEGVYVPVRGPAGDTVLDPVETLQALRPVLENDQIEKVGQNLKYDMVVLRGADSPDGGVELAGLAFDTMVADYLLESGARNHSMDELARRYLNHTTIKIKDLIGTGKNQKRMDEVPVELVGPYAAEDADVPVRLEPLLARRLDEEELTDLFRDLEIPLIEALAECEFNGIRLDVDRLQQLSDDYSQRLAKLEEQIHDLAGRPFNINSPKQLGEVLFDDLGLPVIKKTKTGRSTDMEVLEELAKRKDLQDTPGRELAERIVQYRHFSKLIGTYVDALPQLVHPQTGRVHTSLNQVVAATGRLSSNDPNLQNIPVRTEEGREIRSAFVPGHDGWSLLAADYSQVELRVLAHYCGDEALCRAFADGEDIHARVASQVNGVPLEAVTSEMRRSAKAINFGIIYGQSPFGLAKALDIDKEEAAAFIDAYFAQYPTVDEFMNDVLDICRQQGYVSTLLGRRRKIDGVRSAEKRTIHTKTLPERTAINTVIQGSAADLIKIAMVNIHRRLRSEAWQSKMLLQVHDELVFECPPNEIDTLAAMVREEMSGAYDLAVPLKVDVKSGPNWAACEAM